MENIVAELKAKALAKFGFLPIVPVHETVYRMNYETDDHDIDVDSCDVYYVDFELMTDDDNGEIRYVKHILEDAINGVTIHTGMRKYSFSDTPEWFVKFNPTSSDRTRLIPEIQHDVTF